MHNPPEPPDDDPLGLEGVDREIRIEKLRREIDEVAGGAMFSGQTADCDPKVEEAFLGHVLALETHGFVCPFDTLVQAGFELPPPEKLDDATLTTKLWELIRELRKLRPRPIAAHFGAIVARSCACRARFPLNELLSHMQQSFVNPLKINWLQHEEK